MVILKFSRKTLTKKTRLLTGESILSDFGEVEESILKLQTGTAKHNFIILWFVEAWDLSKINLMLMVLFRKLVEIFFHKSIRWFSCKAIQNKWDRLMYA